MDEIKVTSHPNYLRHNGKPLVAVWGMGLKDHFPDDPKISADLIAWFKNGAPDKYRVTYIGGTPSRWAILSNDARPDPAWANVYAAMDVVQPWTVGRYGSLEDADKWKDDMLVRDAKLAETNRQIYRKQLRHGEFRWIKFAAQTKLKKGI